MPICAVMTCGERGQFACKKSEGQIISFHRFPSDQYPDIKAKWIRATGQRKTTHSWQPTKESTICSKHFKKEDFLTCTDLKISAVPISEEPLLDDHNEQEIMDRFLKDCMDNSDTDSADEIIELPPYIKVIRNKEFIEEDKEKDIPIEYEPPTTVSPHDQSESNQPIAILDSEPEFSETSSELEFTELESSETKSSQLSVDTIESPQGSDEQPPYGMKISKAYSTRKRLILTKDQMKTNIKMYRVDPVTNTVLPVKRIPKDSLFTNPTKIKRKNRNHPEKPMYLIKTPAASLAGNSLLNQNCSLQFANNRAKIISPETGSSSNRVITLSLHKEEQKKVFSTPVPKLAQINQNMSANKTDILQKVWKATKLNPTIETAGRVKKHKTLKVNSIIKKISPSGKRPQLPFIIRQLPLASSNVSKPKPTASRPTTSVSTLADSMLTSTILTSTSTASTPTPADLMLTSTVSTPSPAYSMAIPADSTPPLAGSTLTPATKPIPADSSLTPADSTRTRADLMEIPADSTPSPADSMPTPAEAMQIPADSTPLPADFMPRPGEATLLPTDSKPTLIPAGSVLTPTALIPTPAVLSPRELKLNDSNIHTSDEYDTFAKHVATQLRQLSLESYLSAQGEIQSVLSKYRLCDLDAIKKKNMIDL